MVGFATKTCPNESCRTDIAAHKAAAATHMSAARKLKLAAQRRHKARKVLRLVPIVNSERLVIPPQRGTEARVRKHIRQVLVTETERVRPTTRAPGQSGRGESTDAP